VKNRYLSALYLPARCNLGRVIGVTWLTAALCFALVWFAPGYESVIAYDVNGAPIRVITTSAMNVRLGFLDAPLALGFFWVVLALASVGVSRNSRPELLLYRLRLRMPVVMLLWAVYNAVMLLFFRAMVTLGIYGGLYLRFREQGWEPLFLAAYERPLLHNLLPLRDTAAWWALVLLTVFLAAGCAVTSRRPEGESCGYLYVGAASAMSASGMTNYMGAGLYYIFVFVPLLLLGVLVYRILNEEEEDHEAPVETVS